MLRLSNESISFIRSVTKEVETLLSSSKLNRAANVIKSHHWENSVFEAFIESLYSRSPLKRINWVPNLIIELSAVSFDKKLIAIAAEQWLQHCIHSESLDLPLLAMAMRLALIHSDPQSAVLCAYNRFTLYADANIKRLLPELDAEEKAALIPALMDTYLHKYNAGRLYYLAVTESSLFFEALWHLEEESRKLIIDMLAISSDADRERFTLAMNSFVYEPDRIDYDAGLLTCAQIQSRKPYFFSPVMLRDLDEFEAFIRILKQVSAPVRERFILAGGGHWICGDIQIDAVNKLHCLVIDSMGSHRYEVQGELLDSIASGAGSLVRVAQQFFNHLTVYFAPDKRQQDPVSCKVSSIEDSMHLYTLEKYLPDASEKSNLFDYLAAQKSGEIWLDQDGLLVKSCDLPLSLARSKQSRRLLSETIPGRSQAEQSLPVNKKGETAHQSALKHFRYNNEGEKLTNERLSDKYHQMARYNAAYLLAVNENEVECAKHAFTLEGCRQRLLAQLPVKRVASNLCLFKHTSMPTGSDDVKNTTFTPHIPI